MTQPVNEMQRRSCPNLSVFDGLSGISRPADWREAEAEEYRGARQELLDAHRATVETVSTNLFQSIEILSASAARTQAEVRIASELRGLTTVLKSGELELLPYPVRDSLRTLITTTPRTESAVLRLLDRQVTELFAPILGQGVQEQAGKLCEQLDAFETVVAQGQEYLVLESAVGSRCTALRHLNRNLRRGVDAQEPAANLSAQIAEVSREASRLAAITIDRHAGDLTNWRVLGRMGGEALRKLAAETMDLLMLYEPSSKSGLEPMEELSYLIALGGAVFAPKQAGYTAQPELYQVLARRTMNSIRDLGGEERFLHHLEAAVMKAIDAPELPTSAVLQIGVEARSLTDQFRVMRTRLQDSLKIPENDARELVGGLGIQQTGEMLAIIEGSATPGPFVGAMLRIEPRIAVNHKTRPLQLQRDEFSATLAWLRQYVEEAGELIKFPAFSPLHNPRRFCTDDGRRALHAELQEAKQDTRMANLRPHKLLYEQLGLELKGRGVPADLSFLCAAVLVFGFAPGEAGMPREQLVGAHQSLGIEQLRVHLPAESLGIVADRESLLPALQWLVKKGYLSSSAQGKYRLVHPADRALQKLPPVSGAETNGQQIPPNARVVQFYRNRAEGAR